MRSIDILAPEQEAAAGSKEININELSAEIAKQIREGIKASVKEVAPDADEAAEAPEEKEGEENA